MKKIIRLINKIYFKFLSNNSIAKKKGVKFGKNCKFLTSHFGSEPYLISIGDNFYTSSEVRFITHDGSINVLRNLFEEHRNSDYFSPIKIGNNVFIGYGAIILPGTIIGNNVIIGAGSIVKGKLGDNSVYAGSIAKYICSLDEYREKVKDQLIDTKNLSSKKKFDIIKQLVKN